MRTKRRLMTMCCCLAMVACMTATAQAWMVDEFVPVWEEGGGRSPAGRTGPGGKTTNSLGMEFVWIEPGSFMMGSPSSESGRDDDEKQHRVTLTKGFYMQITEVTVGQWREFVLDTGYRTEAETGDGAYVWTGSAWKKKAGYYWDRPGFSQADSHPVTCVSWNDAQKFINWLNRKDNKNYRLPTEAEWEYACRAGTTGPFNTGDCLSTSQANYNGNYPLSGCSEGQYREKTVPAASFSANAWGLYDMHGNVWEWCSDWYGDYPSGSVTDPEGPSSGSNRVARGGSWDYRAQGCRSAGRGGSTPGLRRSCPWSSMQARPHTGKLRFVVSVQDQEQSTTCR